MACYEHIETGRAYWKNVRELSRCAGQNVRKKAVCEKRHKKRLLNEKEQPLLHQIRQTEVLEIVENAEEKTRIKHAVKKGYRYHDEATMGSMGPLLQTERGF